jgi:ankyrin repeat protein
MFLNKDKKMNTDINLFYEAVRRSNLEDMKSWISSGADVNQLDPYGLTPPHYAIRFLQKDTYILIEIMKSFIENGLDINICATNTRNPFHNNVSLLHYAACTLVDISIIKFLINNGANVNSIDSSGQNALFAALTNNNSKLVIYLIENGINVNLVDNYSMTALHHAVNRSFPNIEIIKNLIENGVNINQPDKGGRTALYLAIQWDIQYNVLEFLINNGANINQCDNEGKNPVLKCFYNGEKKNIQILLAAGFNYTNYTGYIDIIVSKEITLFHERTIVRITVLGYRTYIFPKKEIELVGFNAIRKRAGTICIAMQDLDLPAPQTIEIIVQACVPFAENLPYHYLWDLVVMVKHFHDRQQKLLVK